jgi:cytochrome c
MLDWDGLAGRATLIAAIAAAGGLASLDASAGSVTNGKAIYQKQCLVCHAVEPEFHKEGPSLAGVYGRRAGTAPFFAGYKSLKGADVVWDEVTLDAWLADPRGFAGGRDTGMTLHLDDPAQRADVIAFLKTLR